MCTIWPNYFKLSLFKISDGNKSLTIIKLSVSFQWIYQKLLTLCRMILSNYDLTVLELKQYKIDDKIIELTKDYVSFRRQRNIHST